MEISLNFKRQSLCVASSYHVQSSTRRLAVVTVVEQHPSGV